MAGRGDPSTCISSDGGGGRQRGPSARISSDRGDGGRQEVFTVPPHSRWIPGGIHANSMWIPSIPYGICLAEGPAILV